MMDSDDSNRDIEILEYSCHGNGDCGFPHPDMTVGVLPEELLEMESEGWFVEGKAVRIGRRSEIVDGNTIRCGDEFTMTGGITTQVKWVELRPDGDTWVYVSERGVGPVVLPKGKTIRIWR